jgi:prolipoprotein diacylglyceryltransferase
VIRFAIEFVRDDPRGDILGLTTLTGLSTSQLISIIVGISSLIILIVRKKTRENPTSPTHSANNSIGNLSARSEAR